ASRDGQTFGAFSGGFDPVEPEDAGCDRGSEDRAAGSARGAERSGGGDVRAGASARGVGALRGSLRAGADRGSSVAVGREYPRVSPLLGSVRSRRRSTPELVPWFVFSRSLPIWL